MQSIENSKILILASQSPRRKYLLSQAGIQFKVIPSQVDESTVPMTSPESYVKILAERKAQDVARQYPENYVIGADTIVLLDGTILGKPRSRNEARQMLTRLSGETHQVLTGFALCCTARSYRYSDAVKTDVRFKKLAPEEIEWYIHTPEPFDKAGAYAIQGLGTFLVKSINGSYTNVVGLPVCEVIELLLKEGIIGLNGPSRTFDETG
ncbi:MAG TPA: septum formation inhibitor Maf [Deltaproteobacteria bacterium]|nr:septum formation inhibitor Maf [Deltaproteobacteria bacterium]